MKAATVRPYRSSARVTIEIDPNTHRRLQQMLVHDHTLRGVGYSDFLDWAMDVHERNEYGLTKVDWYQFTEAELSKASSNEYVMKDYPDAAWEILRLKCDLLPEAAARFAIEELNSFGEV